MLIPLSDFQVYGRYDHMLCRTARDKPKFAVTARENLWYPICYYNINIQKLKKQSRFVHRIQKNFTPDVKDRPTAQTMDFGKVTISGRLYFLREYDNIRIGNFRLFYYAVKRKNYYGHRVLTKERRMETTGCL